MVESISHIYSRHAEDLRKADVSFPGFALVVFAAAAHSVGLAMGDPELGKRAAEGIFELGGVGVGFLSRRPS